jgi:hypothetical protein
MSSLTYLDSCHDQQWLYLGEVASVQLTDRSRRDLWPIKSGYPSPTTEHWKSVPQYPRMLTLSSLCCWGRSHKSAWDVYRFQVGPSGPRNSLVSNTTVAYQLVTTTATLVVWELLSLTIQQPGNHRTHLRRSVWIVTIAMRRLDSTTCNAGGCHDGDLMNLHSYRWKSICWGWQLFPILFSLATQEVFKGESGELPMYK